MLQKKWIFILLFSTFLWAEHNETNTSNETGIWTTISHFFGLESNESNETQSDFNLSHPIKNPSTKENNDTNTSNENNTSKVTKHTYSELPNDMSQFDGTWHLRVMDGMEVRKARAILDFTFNDKKAELSGFDGCNRITGKLKMISKNTLNIPFIRATKMACRQNIHNWVSTQLHKTLKEGFSLKEEKKHGIEGITIKSLTHELFFKKMERD